MIRKWALPVGFTMPLETGENVILVGEQNELPTIWTSPSPFMREDEHLVVKWYPTGGEPAEDEHHLGSVQMESGLVWHLFGVLKKGAT